MTAPRYVAIPTREEMDEAIDAYARAVGRVSGAWNYLHRTLGGLFAVVIGGEAELVIAAWRSVENDRTQREMLCAAIKAASPKRWEQTPKAPDDLLWVLKRADKLADVRNDAIHAQVSLHLVPELAMDVLLPPRGKREKKLVDRAAKGKKLLEELVKCEQDTDALTVFVRQAYAALAKPDQQGWPTPRPKQIW